MSKLVAAIIAAVALLCATSASADAVRINNDEAYSRLARWERDLDHQIADGIRDNAIDPRRAWRLQKNLDSVEIHLLQNHYRSDDGIDRDTARRYARQLRRIARELGDEDDGSRYGFGYEDYGRANRGYGPPPPQYNYYQEGAYESQCRQGNTIAGTIFGALAGGLLGSGLSHGNGAATVGGVILGGVVGNRLAQDINCDNQRYAFATYDEGLNGEVGREYRWHHGGERGTFTAIRQYREDGYICRDFRTVTYRGDQRYERDGSACHEDDGNWHMR